MGQENEEIDDNLNAPLPKPIFKRKVIKKNTARRKVDDIDDDDIPKLQISAKPNFRKVPQKRKYDLLERNYDSLEMTMELAPYSIEDAPTIENLNELDQITRAQLAPEPELIPIKKYVPIQSTSTDILTPTIDQYKQEYNDYDPEDITDKKSPTQLDEDIELDININELNMDMNDGNPDTRPNSDFYDLELNDHDDDDDDDNKTATNLIILSIADQIEKIKLDREKLIASKLENETKIKSVQSQLSDIELKKEKLLYELTSSD